MSPTEILTLFEEIKEPFFTHRRFKHRDILSLIKKSSLQKEVIGRSFEGREIYKLKWGEGAIKVLLWSQMHGNEATATMALFDLFRFFENQNNGFVDLLKGQLEIHFVPMLNPDGAERFTRRTAQQIDMNRDALALACPESKLFKKLHEELKPDFSFNLHDQDVRWAAGHSPNQASIAFLATAYDEACNWNETRTEAMQVICEMNDILQNFIPGKVGRFSDEFEPRAFGDNIQKWGSRLILIESGGNGNQREKMELRKLNFLIILKAFEAIAKQSFTNRTLKEYESIPLNTKCLFDLLIKNAEYEGQKIDVGIYLNEKNNQDATDYTLESCVEDIGDLSTSFGIETFDADGYVIEALDQFSGILTKYKDQIDGLTRLSFEKKANFALTKNGKPSFAVINGRIYPI
ncbi:M14 family zinc carboxypeptidase [Jiulongibacter sp. NS-SX5]|uniref:M14 family zinc carboxypeptidase n=1 Tax=Jiulongibacter sp. NS-SX5 TaxID=3463854 RepID=UPI004059D13E